MNKNKEMYKELKNKYPELYEAIIAHSIWYECGLGEGHVMDDMALPLGWLASYLGIAEDNMRKRCVHAFEVSMWLEGTLTGIQAKKILDQATQNINNLDKGNK